MSVERQILRYHGSKWKLARQLVIPNMPKHKVYVEPFGGGGNVLLRKDRVAAEIYNDLDGRVVNVFRCLQNLEKAEAIKRRLSLTPFARAEFDSCYEPATDDVDDACKTIMLSFMGHGTDAITRSCRTGFRVKMTDSRATPAAPWGTYYEAIDSFVERLRGVVVECRDATEVMLRTDSKGTVFYVDPPYVSSTRSSVTGRSGATHGYQHEMTDEDHRSLAVVLRELRGMVMLSGYPSKIYDELYGGWDQLRFDSLADGAKERVECLWFNKAAWAKRPQMQLIRMIA